MLFNINDFKTVVLIVENIDLSDYVDFAAPPLWFPTQIHTFNKPTRYGTANEHKKNYFVPLKRLLLDYIFYFAF